MAYCRLQWLASICRLKRRSVFISNGVVTPCGGNDTVPKYSAASVPINSVSGRQWPWRTSSYLTSRRIPAKRLLPASAYSAVANVNDGSIQRKYSAIFNVVAQNFGDVFDCRPVNDVTRRTYFGCGGVFLSSYFVCRSTSAWRGVAIGCVT